MGDRKTRPGFALQSLDRVRDYAERGTWFYLRGRPKAPAIIQNMSFDTVAGFVENNQLRLAMSVARGAPYKPELED